MSAALHSLGHIDCPVCEKSLDSITEKIDASLPFQQASANWLAKEKVINDGLAPRTLRDLAEYIKCLREVMFAKIPLEQIHLGHIGIFRNERLLMCGPERVNKEVSILIRIKQAADCWTEEMRKLYRPLDQPASDIPRALTPDEQSLWLEATDCERLLLIHWYTVAALATCASTNELRALKLGDINLQQRVILVRWRSAKNPHRQRTIPIRQEAIPAFEWLMARAVTLGARENDHHLFPFFLPSRDYDPTRPMGDSGLKKLWNEAREITGLSWRPYDIRHTGCTRLAEAGVPAPVIMSYAGHFSRKMYEHYQHISEQAQKVWGEIADERLLPPKKPSSSAVEIAEPVGKPLSG